MSSSVQRLTEADVSATLNRYPGERFEVVLSGNPAAGYQWEASSWDEAVLTRSPQPDYRQQSSAVGSGGEFIFVFEAVAAGRSTVQLIYHRPFETARKPLRTYEFTVVVKTTGA